MKIMAVGDFHYTEKQPGSRRDSIGDAFFSKLIQICILTKKLNADVLVQPGDFFDSHRANDLIKAKLIRFLRNNPPLDDGKILTLYGQHDLRYHRSDINNTPLNVIDASGLVHILNYEPYEYMGVNFYGASWFEDIPQPKYKENYNVLVLHKMIVDEKIWEGQEDHIFHNLLLKKNRDYNLIISGDNHKTFTAQSGSRALINAGSLLRTRIDQEDHHPCVFLIDTDKGTIDQHFLEIKPFKDVIIIEEARRKKEENETLKKYAEALKSDNTITGINYRRNIKEHMENNKDSITNGMRIFVDRVFKKIEVNNGINR